MKIPASNPEVIKKDQTAMNTLAEKIDALSSERDSIFNYSSSLKINCSKPLSKGIFKSS